jgi:WD40 repeat protein
MALVPACGDGNYAPPYIKPTAGSSNLGGEPSEGGSNSDSGGSEASGGSLGSGGSAVEQLELLSPCYDFGSLTTSVSVTETGVPSLVTGPLGAVLIDPLESRVLWTVPALHEKLMDAAISPDGTFVVVAEQSQSVRVWSVADKMPIFSTTEMSVPRAVAFVPGETPRIIVATAAGSVALLDLETKRVIWRRETGYQDPKNLFVSDDGSQIWMQAGGSIVRFDTDDGEPVNRFYEGLLNFSASRGGKRLVLLFQSSARVLDAESFAVVSEFEDVRAGSSVAIDSKGETIYVQDSLGLHIVAAGSGMLQADIPDLTAHDMATFENDTRLLVTGGRTTVIDLESQSEVGGLGENDYADDVVFLANNRMAVLSQSGNLGVWDLDDGKSVDLPAEPDFASAQFEQILPAQDLSLAVVGTSAIFFDQDLLTANWGSPLDEFDPPGGAKPMFLTQDGTTLVGQGTSSTANAITLWDVETGEAKLSFLVEGGLNDLQRSPGADTFATAGATGIRIVDVETQKVLSTFDSFISAVSAVAYSSDGSRIAATTTGGGIFVLSAAGGAILKTVRSDGASTADASATIAYSSTGILAVVSDTVAQVAKRPGYITLIDAESGGAVGQLFSHDDDAFLPGRVEFSPDSKYLSMTSSGGGVRVWCLDDLKK